MRDIRKASTSHMGLPRRTIKHSRPVAAALLGKIIFTNNPRSSALPPGLFCGRHEALNSCCEVTAPVFGAELATSRAWSSLIGEAADYNGTGRYLFPLP